MPPANEEFGYLNCAQISLNHLVESLKMHAMNKKKAIEFISKAAVNYIRKGSMSYVIISKAVEN